MTFGFGKWKIALVALLCSVVASCSAIYRNHGYVPSEDELSEIVVGLDTRGTVETIVGRPSAAGILDEGGWYYVRSQYRTFAYRKPQEIDRQVVAITFGDEDVVTNIERFGLEDGRVVALSRRVTDKNTQGIGFLRQAFGNLGRFNPADLLGGDG
jgi:outer membrane protein assembly factor BamE (lipoprotein component of BamABCDE complex)